MKKIEDMTDEEFEKSMRLRRLNEQEREGERQWRANIIEAKRRQQHKEIFG